MLELEGRAVAEGLLEDLLVLAEGNRARRVSPGSRPAAESALRGGSISCTGSESPLGNTKLASRPATADELAERPRRQVKVLIETRGEAGYAIVAPSSKIHPTGGRWTLLTAGGFATIAPITADRRGRPVRAVPGFDRMPVEPRQTGSRPAPTGPATGTTPGRHSGRDPGHPRAARLDAGLLKGGADFLLRPGKDGPSPAAGRSRPVSARRARRPGACSPRAPHVWH